MLKTRLTKYCLCQNFNLYCSVGNLNLLQHTLFLLTILELLRYLCIMVFLKTRVARAVQKTNSELTE